MRGAIAISLVVPLVLVVACKVDKDETKQTQPKPTSGGSATATAASGPVEALQPELPNAKQLQVRTKSDHQITSIWCVDTSQGRDAVVQVADKLRADGWSDVSTRGSADRFGVAGNKGDVRLSATIGGRDQGCTGTLVIMTLVRLSEPVKIPPATEPIR